MSIAMRRVHTRRSKQNETDEVALAIARSLGMAAPEGLTFNSKKRKKKASQKVVVPVRRPRTRSVVVKEKPDSESEDDSDGSGSEKSFSEEETSEAEVESREETDVDENSDDGSESDDEEPKSEQEESEEDVSTSDEEVEVENSQVGNSDDEAEESDEEESEEGSSDELDTSMLAESSDSEAEQSEDEKSVSDEEVSEGEDSGTESEKSAVVKTRGQKKEIELSSKKAAPKKRPAPKSSPKTKKRKIVKHESDSTIASSNLEASGSKTQRKSIAGKTSKPDLDIVANKLLSSVDNETKRAIIASLPNDPEFKKQLSARIKEIKSSDQGKHLPKPEPQHSFKPVKNNESNTATKNQIKEKMEKVVSRKGKMEKAVSRKKVEKPLKTLSVKKSEKPKKTISRKRVENDKKVMPPPVRQRRVFQHADEKNSVDQLLARLLDNAKPGAEVQEYAWQEEAGIDVTDYDPLPLPVFKQNPKKVEDKVSPKMTPQNKPENSPQHSEDKSPRNVETVEKVGPAKVNEADYKNIENPYAKLVAQKKEEVKLKVTEIPTSAPASASTARVAAAERPKLFIPNSNKTGHYPGLAPMDKIPTPQTRAARSSVSSTSSAGFAPLPFKVLPPPGVALAQTTRPVLQRRDSKDLKLNPVVLKPASHASRPASAARTGDSYSPLHSLLSHLGQGSKPKRVSIADDSDEEMRTHQPSPPKPKVLANSSPLYTPWGPPEPPVEVETPPLEKDRNLTVSASDVGVFSPVSPCTEDS